MRYHGVYDDVYKEKKKTQCKNRLYNRQDAKYSTVSKPVSSVFKYLQHNTLTDWQKSYNQKYEKVKKWESFDARKL